MQDCNLVLANDGLKRKRLFYGFVKKKDRIKRTFGSLDPSPCFIGIDIIGPFDGCSTTLLKAGRAFALSALLS